MLNNISIKKFRSLSDINKLNIKPITVFCGANSCGKSTILKSLLLLKQNLENVNINREIILNGEYTRLGNYKDTVYKHNISDDLSLSYVFDIDQDTRKNMGLRNVINRMQRLVSFKMDKFTIEFNIKIGLNEIQSQNSFMYPIVKEYTVNIFNKSQKIDAKVTLAINVQNTYDISYYDINSDILHSKKLETGSIRNVPIHFAGMVPISITVFDYKSKSDDLYITKAIYEFLQNSNFILQKFVTNFSYIGPLREEPSRRYFYDNVVNDIGIKGQNAPYLYLAEKNLSLQNHYFYDNVSDRFYQEENILLKDALDRWLTVLDINNFDVTYDKDIIRITLSDKNNSETKVNIADVGFGISQVFPILLEGLRMPLGSRLFLEQPEIHLHPQMQMDMADYFIALAKSGKNFMIETHSDHIINRLVRRIVEDETEQLSKIIQIYFVNPTENGSNIEPIIVDSVKGIVNWPDGFFDQNASEQELILMAQIKRKKKLLEQNQRM